ncbi:MAG TPA: hypothetical protein VF030_03055, partial [Solirubrobacterales bacterium]
VIVHSITTWPPCSIRFSMYHWASIVCTPSEANPPIVSAPLVRAEARVVVSGVVGEVRRHRLSVASVQRLVVSADALPSSHGTKVVLYVCRQSISRMNFLASVEA